MRNTHTCHAVLLTGHYKFAGVCVYVSVCELHAAVLVSVPRAMEKTIYSPSSFKINFMWGFSRGLQARGRELSAAVSGERGIRRNIWADEPVNTVYYRTGYQRHTGEDANARDTRVTSICDCVYLHT